MSQISPAPTKAEQAKVLDLLVDLFYAHRIEIHNIWEDKDLQGSTKEPLVTSGFAISLDGHTIGVFPEETYLTAENLEGLFEELREDND